MAKAKTPTDEKFEKIDFDLFEALAAIDKKDYGYYDRLTEEQKKKFVPFMILQWISSVKASRQIQEYYLLAANDFANKYLYNENVQKNPKLQWLLLCSIGLGTKQFHTWIPQIKERVSKLKEKPKYDDISQYYSKIYPKADSELIKQISEKFVEEYGRKVYLANKFPNLKIDEIEVLSKIVSHEDINKYEEQEGN
jgi:hypothetical protein